MAVPARPPAGPLAPQGSMPTTSPYCSLALASANNLDRAPLVSACGCPHSLVMYAGPSPKKVSPLPNSMLGVYRYLCAAMPAQAAHHLLYCLCHGHGGMCNGDHLQLVSSVRAGFCSSTRLWGVTLLPTPTVLLLHTGQGHSKVNSVTTHVTETC